MKRPAGSKNPERKGFSGTLGKAFKAVGSYLNTVSGAAMFDNQSQPGEMPAKKKVSPNSAAKTVNKPKNKW